MAWNLQIVPKGLLLSKYIRNVILLNPNNVSDVAYNQLLSDQFQTFSATNNTVNLNFQLSIYNTDPRNEAPQPSIISINYIIISNDPNFQQIYTLIPAEFVSTYNFQTNYSFDLLPYNVSQVSLPSNQSITFLSTSGTGLITIKNWPLSGSSGLKKVFVSISVLLSDGTVATYPNGFNVFDEITVCSGYISSPNIPEIIGKTSNSYTSSPLYYGSRIASNSGELSIDDYGMASYFWDSLILNSPLNIVRNNYSPNNIQLFKTSGVKTFNSENLPIVFTSSVSTGIAYTAQYNTYTTSSFFSLNSSNNIYFFEAFVNNYSDIFGYEAGSSFFYEFNITNSTGSIKYLRQQLIFNETFTTLTVITSVDDSTWSTDVSYIPSALNQSFIITNPEVVARLTQSGIYLLLIEIIDSVNNVYQSKLLFKPDGANNSFVINELLFTSNDLINGTNIYGQFRSFIRNSTYTVILESVQYGICQGTISAAIMPTDKILTNKQLNIQNNIVNFYNSEQLNTWFTISNSPSSGVLNSDGTSVYFLNNQINDSQNNLSAIEIQGTVPTFSEDSTLTSVFSILGSASQIIKTGYSTDSNLNYSNFIFNDLLKTTSGLYLPQQNAFYDLIASLNWIGSGAFNLSVYDVGSAQTCGISTTVTNNLFFYSQSNTQGALEPPIIIKTSSSISSSDTFSVWIGTSGISTSNIINQSVTIKNQGNIPISINTGIGLNTINPGQPYVFSPISIQTASPSSFTINTQLVSITSSINFLYDFGQLGTINQVGLSISITTPPDCPSILPSIQYSIEVSEDFITWVYLTNSSATETFSPNTGNINLVFLTPNNSGDINFYRYLRLRLYKNSQATFDPTKVWKYSSFIGQQNPSSVVSMTGKLIFGFTDTSALSNTLGQLYNQPTYLRKFITNETTVLGLVLDFSDYESSNGVYGPVYFSLLTQSGETRFYTITNNFQINNSYSVSFTVQRLNSDNAFKLQPSFSITGITSSAININLDDIITEPSDTQLISFGYYPFISLVGNGNVKVNSSVFSGTYNHGLGYSTNIAYFSLLSAEDADYTSNYGKYILAQNTYGISTSTLPIINSYFNYNQIQIFDYNNTTFTVLAAATIPLSLYGLTYVDGVYLSVCDYVLVAGQSDKTTNGVYQVQLQQWVKQNSNPAYPSPIEPTVLVTQGNIFGDTLWMQDNISMDWIPNVIVCPFVLNNDNLLFTGISSCYKYPQYVKLGVGVGTVTNINSLDQVKIKFANSPNGYLSDTDSVTQWNSLLQNGQLNSIREKGNSNNTVFMNFGFSSVQMSGINTQFFPALYNLIVAYSGNYIPMITQNSNFVLPNYGSSYRAFNNPNLIYQFYSFSEKVAIGSVNSSVVDSAVYGLNVAGVKSPQSGYSTDLIIDTLSPVLGILSYISDNVKSVTLGLSSVLDAASGVALARIVQKNPSNELIYGTWFGFTTSSYNGINTLTVYPSYVTNTQGISTGEPLSGYYRYSVQVSDYVGNISQTNFVENFYYESAIVDTQGPSGTVSFVASDNITPISINSSSTLNAQLFVSDSLTSVKAYRFRIMPDGVFGNWIDFNNFADIYLPQNISDGSLSIQFQFKDFGNNILYQDDTIPNEQTYVYTWNIVSALINNVLFTVTEVSTYNNNPVLIIGASNQGTAAIYLWNASQLIQLQYSGFAQCKAITALLNVNGQVLIGTDNGSIFIYQNGIITGPYTQLTWGGTGLPISKFVLHQYASDNISYVYASTLNIPRVFRTPSNNLGNLTWQVIQPNPISITQVNVLNTGLWSGLQAYYSISSSYQAAVLNPVLSYGISSVIVNNPGFNLTSPPAITLSGGITGASLTPIMQGKINNLNLLNGGVGYTSGATVNIAAPAIGGLSIQAVGYAITNSLGQIVSIGLTSQGYGYTSINPTVTINGVNGSGIQAVVSAVTLYDSIYSVSVASPGISTTTAITATATGNVSLSLSFIYSVNSLSISNPGFGYTSSPLILINGLSTIASAVVKYGSVQSVSILSTIIFPASLSPSVITSGGLGTNWTGTLNTNNISFSTGYSISYSGTILNSINLTSGGYGISTLPSISFSTSIASPIYNPELQFILSDDLTLYNPSGSIYDIKSFNQSLFFTSSKNGIIKLDFNYNNNGSFNASQINLNNSSNYFNTLIPYALSVYNNNLYFSCKEKPFIGLINQTLYKNIFSAYQDNILLFKPYNFDILSDWQLTKILNTNGICTAGYGDSNNNTLLISNKNSQIFYESTKNNTWFNRCSISNSYLVTFVFNAIFGTQSVEISTFNSILKIAFTANEDNLQISFGNATYQSIQIGLNLIYNISFVNNSGDLFIYSNGDLVYQSNNLIAQINSYPVIKFGYIFEPQQVSNYNGQTQNIFALPVNINSSQFIWHKIMFSFNTNDLVVNNNSYELNIPYVLPNSSSVRVLKTLNNNLYAVTKSLTDTRYTTNVSDASSKVYQLSNNIWSDVTGTFISTSVGVNTSYIIASPNDINVLNNSYFITGLIKSVPNSLALQDSITLGFSTNITFEEQNILLTVIYPYNPYPSGALLTITNNNNLLFPPSNMYFAPSGSIVQAVTVGIASTSISTVSALTVSDGITTSTISATINPIGIATIGINTPSFVNYSIDSVLANVQLQATPKTNRTFNLTSSIPSILSTPNNGFSTVFAGNISVSVPLTVGIATTTSGTINITASYRSSVGTASVTYAPFILSAGLNTSSIWGAELYTQVFSTFSVQRAPKASLNVALQSSASGLLSVPAFSTIYAGSLSTTTQLNSSNPELFSPTFVSVTGIITGGIATAQIDVLPYTISTIISNYNRLILGLQTATITMSLSTTPAVNISVTNKVQNPLGVSMVYQASQPVFAGTLTTSFAISTSIQTSSTTSTIIIQGAPNNANTTPSPGLFITSDVIRITNLNISPQSIVGGGANANGIAQSYIINATLNYSAIGYATTAFLATNSNFINFGTTQLHFYGTANSIGFATGFTTSLITGVAITASGLVGISSSVYNLVLNPFLINGFTTSYIWNNLSANNYTIGGVGATIIGNVNLNAYVYGSLGVQTIKFTSLNTNLFIYGQAANSTILGFATILSGAYTTSVNFGINQVASTISTNITANIISSSLGIATTTVSVLPIPSYSLIFNPIFAGIPCQYNVYLASPLPVPVTMSVLFSNGQSQLVNIPALQTGIGTQFNFTAFPFDNSFTAQATLLGSLQTYNVLGYANSGGVFGMGYNINGDLSYNYPVIGPGIGSYSKVYMGLPYIVKTVSGYHHTLALDVYGNVYGIGDNSYGQLGYNNQFGLTTNSFVNILFNYQASNIFAQNNTSYVLLANNSLYSFGDNTFNSLGSSLMSYPTISQTYQPQLISNNVQLCSVYNYRGTIVTYSNTTAVQSVYEFGNNLNGIVGKGITQFSTQAQVSNLISISNLNFNSLSVGPYHTAASGIWSWTSGLYTGVTSSGLFAWGQNTYGQVGLSSAIASVVTPNILYQNVSYGITPIGYTTLIVADWNFTLGIASNNVMYQVGAGNTTNSTGLSGIAQTYIATPYYGFATTSAIYHISRDLNHYVWVLGLGSVFVSGGFSFGPLINISYLDTIGFLNGILLFNQNSYEYLNLNGYVSPNGQYINSTNGVYVWDYLKSTGDNTNAFTKFLQQPLLYSGPTIPQIPINVFGAGMQPSNPPLYPNTIYIFYGSAEWSFGPSNGFSNIVDITMGSNGPNTIIFENNSSIYIFVLTSSHIFYIRNVGLPPSDFDIIFSGYSFAWTGTPVLIDSTYITNYMSSSWTNSMFNFILGYQGGKIEIYGTPDYGTTISLIGQWTVDTTVSCVQSIQNNASPNNIYLFIATQSGNLYVYNGNGGGNYLINNSQSTSLPPLLGQTTINSTYGYIQHIQHYISGSIIASTSNNYLLVLSSTSLQIIASILVPSEITSITYGEYFSGSGYAPAIFVSTSTGISYAYYLNLPVNYEIGLNYANIGGSYQLMTYDGTQSGIGVTNIFHASTDDTFTIILDSSRPNGIF